MAAQSITELFWHLVILHMQGRGVGHLSCEMFGFARAATAKSLYSVHGLYS